MNTLAIDGGAPVRTEPLPPWPYFTEEEATAAADVLRSGKVNYWTGTKGREFEARYAERLGVEHAVAVANGTVSLELSLRALGVGEGHDVITTPRTFVGTATAIVAVGARPVFAEIDPVSQNITPDSVEAAWTANTRAVIPVHLAGWPADIPAMVALAESRGAFVIEDCAQAHGARFRGERVGSMGHVGSFSFCQDKILTTAGEGGLVATSNEDVFKRVWSLKDHGKSWDAVYERAHPPGFRWLVESFGTNLRMTEVQAAVGLIGLERLDDDVARRRALACRLHRGLGGYDAIRRTTPPDDVMHAYYRYYAFVQPEALASGWDRDRLAAAISAEGIPCMQGSCSEIYRERAFTNDMRPAERLPVARELGETSLMFLVHPTMTEADVDDAIAAVRKVLAHATR